MSETSATLSSVTTLIDTASSICVFSGAGISVASGIPDFRSEGGLWEKFDPTVCADYRGFLSDPRPFWEMCYACDSLLSSAKPNAAHYALAALEHKLAKRVTIITQNIDGLHSEAGSRVVHEVHGSFKTGSCISCRALGDETQFTMDEIRKMIRPPMQAKQEGSRQTDSGDLQRQKQGSLVAVTIPHCPKCGSTQVLLYCASKSHKVQYPKEVLLHVMKCGTIYDWSECICRQPHSRRVRV
jgi:NAD-dependent SIR2 family protein deacetylase